MSGSSPTKIRIASRLLIRTIPQMIYLADLRTTPRFEHASQRLIESCKSDCFASSTVRNMTVSLMSSSVAIIPRFASSVNTFATYISRFSATAMIEVCSMLAIEGHHGRSSSSFEGLCGSNWLHFEVAAPICIIVWDGDRGYIFYRDGSVSAFRSRRHIAALRYPATACLFCPVCVFLFGLTHHHTPGSPSAISSLTLADTCTIAAAALTQSFVLAAQKFSGGFLDGDCESDEPRRSLPYGGPLVKAGISSLECIQTSIFVLQIPVQTRIFIHDARVWEQWPNTSWANTPIFCVEPLISYRNFNALSY